MPEIPFTYEDLAQAPLVEIDHPAFGGGIEIFPNLFSQEVIDKIRNSLYQALALEGRFAQGQRSDLGREDEFGLIKSVLWREDQVPGLFHNLFNSIFALTGLKQKNIKIPSVRANLYPPGVGIEPHCDYDYTNEAFPVIKGVTSLTAEGRAQIQVAIEYETELVRTIFYSEKGSAYRLTGPAFLAAKHWIKKTVPKQGEKNRLSISAFHSMP